ncbi:MAG: hypothetical protein LUE17_01535 [Planctomycetaceae bacterium]|nr:hypothetical protein [Planctomycetaceae bacterium]
MKKMFHLNDEELNVLKAVRDLNDGPVGAKTDYYAVVHAVSGDTGRLIPVVGRLDDDGYISSSGVVRRWLKITEKGRNTLKERLGS